MQCLFCDLFPANFVFFAIYTDKICQFLPKNMLYNIKIGIAYIVKKQYLCSRIINPLIIIIMNKENLFNVAEAAFADMLSKNNLYLDYFALWANSKSLNYGDTLYTQWVVWAKSKDVNYWIMSAFQFGKGNIPAVVWCKLDDEWSKWLKQNLNK